MSSIKNNQSINPVDRVNSLRYDSSTKSNLHKESNKEHQSFQEV
jgi:hypothetical protein